MGKREIRKANGERILKKNGEKIIWSRHNPSFLEPWLQYCILLIIKEILTSIHCEGPKKASNQTNQTTIIMMKIEALTSQFKDG